MASSSASFSPPHGQQPSLDTLVGYLLAAKRSLSTVDSVQRANELVTSTKAAFVQQTALSARTSYLRSGCAALFGHLEQMHSQLGSIASESSAEMEEVINSVSLAEKRLQSTLEALHDTMVDAKLRPLSEEPKSLWDFVDRGAMQGLLDEISESLSETDKARQHYEGIVTKLGGELAEIRQALAKSRHRAAVPMGQGQDQGAEFDRSDEPEERGGVGGREHEDHGYDDDRYRDERETSPIPAILQAMEVTAHDMAENLESLVKHYDLCLEVLRHTEGAGAAFSHAASRNELPADQNAAIANEIGAGGRGGQGRVGGAAGMQEDGSNGEHSTDIPALGTEERAHLMEVLASDAAQVEEVVTEISASLASLEASVSRVATHGASLQARYGLVRAAVTALEKAENRLPNYSVQSHLHVVRLDRAKAAITDKIAAVEELAGFYAGFLSAYDRLVIEVGRRKDVARRMRRIRDDAAARLDALAIEDREEREAFRDTHGGFLPRDIWPGLSAPPPRYEVALVEGDASVPDISASVVQRAIRRVSGKPEGKRESLGGQ